MQIKIWGARGSIPTPSTSEFVTSRYGGNTTCVSVRIPGYNLILDAGSGLRNLGVELAKEEGPLKAAFFFTHVHWDHIQGFPFFVPSFIKGNEFLLFGAAQKRQTGVIGSLVENALRGQQRSLNFPVQMDDMGSKLSFVEFDTERAVELEGTESKLVLKARELNHPGGCVGFRIEEHRGDEVKVFAFATDTEHFDKLNPNLQELAKDADVLAYDAQYTEAEYNGEVGIPRKGWGHSTWRHGMDEALSAGAKHLLLTHHDPLHDDWAIARIENDARKEGAKVNLKVDACHEGLEINL